MNVSSITDLCIDPLSPIRQAMFCIDRNAYGIALVVDGERRLLGTVTDGDLRRAILAGVSLDTPVSQLLARKVDSPYAQPITASVNATPFNLLSLMQERHIHQVPLLDAEGHVVDLVTLDELVPKQPLPLQAVIMAGGFGTRLRPLTEDLPKPMLPIGDQPLMEHILKQLRQAGIRRVNVTTHYKPEKIRDYFGNGQEFDVEINYVTEELPLGTAGALGLMPPPTGPLLVINGDILTRVDFRAMLEHHHEHRADMTVAVRQFDLRVPYGVVECTGPRVHGVREKPTFSLLVNAGIYLLEPVVFRYIPTGQRFDMTELIHQLIQDGRIVVSFPVVEYWLDIGQQVDYEQAQQDVQKGRGLF